MLNFLKATLLAVTLTLVLASSSLAALPPAEITTIDVSGWPEDVTNPRIAEDFDSMELDIYLAPVQPEGLRLQQTEQMTPISIITVAQSEKLVYDTFTYAGQVFGALLSIIAMGAGISLGFRIAREVRGFLSGGG